MRIIITENKLEKLQQHISKKVMEDGILDTARMMGMSAYDFISRFGYELEDERITDLIDFFMENRFYKIYNLQEKNDLCERYETPSTFLNVVVEGINEFCYNNFNFTTNYGIDEEDMEYENIFFQMEHYLIKNYGEEIKKYFIDSCKQ